MLGELLEPDVLREVLQAFAREPQLGLVGAARDRARFADVADDALVRAIVHRLGMVLDAHRDTFFVSGLVLVRPAALAPLRAIEIEPSELERDDVLTGALTRSLGLSALAAGFRAEDTRSFRRIGASAAAATG